MGSEHRNHQFVGSRTKFVCRRERAKSRGKTDKNRKQLTERELVRLGNQSKRTILYNHKLESLVEVGGRERMGARLIASGARKKLNGFKRAAPEVTESWEVEETLEMDRGG